MTTYPHCKINLGLHIVGRRPDGYHDIETIFVPVGSLHDELEITPLANAAGTATVIQEGMPLDNAPTDNLCHRAWQLMHRRFGIPPVQIRLRKGIPFGAGLGGGSSDAASTLVMLNEMFHLGLTRSELHPLADEIGADCAFFLLGNSPAYATGTGSTLSPFGLDLSAYDIRIEIPEGEHVSTREAYANVSPRAGRPDLREAVRRPVGEWSQVVHNDFEDSVLPAHPAIAALKERMYRRGALYASMTGSGAAVYGIFPK